MKTLEFKAYLTPRQEGLANQWLRTLRWVWNEGLSLLNELNEHRAWHKGDKASYPCSPIGWDYHWKKGDDDRWEPTRPFCSLARRYCLLPGVAPTLENASYISLANAFAKKNYPDNQYLQAVPRVFIRGTLKSLAKAWEEHRKGKRKPPKYKGRHNPITSLINEDAKATKLYHRRVPISKEFGSVLADRSLLKRWPLQEPTCVVKLCKKADGYYLQLSGKVPYDLPEPTDVAIGIDIGAKFVVATSEGETIDPPRYYRDMQLRLARLQRQLSRQQKDSNRYKRTQKSIAKLHKKIADQRKYFNHSLSTKLVSKTGAIAVEDIQLQNLTKRAKPKKKEDGKGYDRNGASAKSGLTKAMLDNGLGQLRQFLETKSKATGREFIKVPAAYTSQDCSGCGARVKKSLSTRTHVCPECGLILDRDINAAYNILARGEKLFKKSYRACSRKVTDAERKPTEGLDEALIKGKKNYHQYSNQNGAFDVLPGLDLSGFEATSEPRKRQKSRRGRKSTPEPLAQLALDLGGCY